MAILRLPHGGGVDFLGALGLIALCFAALGVVIYLDVRRFRRELERSGLQVKGAWRHILRLSASSKLRAFQWLAIHAALVIGLVATVAVVLTDGFVAVGISDSELRLDYWTRSSVHLPWSEVRSVEIDKRRPRSKWRIIIETDSGQKYGSIFTSTYRDLPQMQGIHDEVRSARAQSQGR